MANYQTKTELSDSIWSNKNYIRSLPKNHLTEETEMYSHTFLTLHYPMQNIFLFHFIQSEDIYCLLSAYYMVTQILYSSVDRALAWEPKGRLFDSQSAHVPGLQARSPVGGVREATS